jgi:hypothetical protein
VHWDFGYCGHYWPIVPASDDRRWWLWRNWWNEVWQGKPKYSEKTCPSATLSTTNPTWLDPILNPGRRDGKPATNRLSYGAAFRDLLNACQFGFRARHSTTLQLMRPTTTWPFISTIIYLRTQCSWTSKKSLIPHGTLACCISYLNWNFRHISSSLLVLFFHNANSVIW